ncbi:MAG: FtsQ-type POTRA domain-containing protein [Rhodobacteraceae bacterium]|nr:MAG: FtsQ-type POTRA domain-containing protein [Paracoccaceae bacterium]
MRALNDPAPAPLRYRLARLWRRRSVRRAATVQAPALALAAFAAMLASDPGVHAALGAQAQAVRAALTARPEFAIRRIEVEGAGPMVEAEVLAVLGDVLGASSIDLDVAALRRRIEGLGWVESARVALDAREALRIAVVERVAAAVWRRDGEPYLIDAKGAEITPAFARADHPDLPLVIGDGAAAAVAEALALHRAAGPLAPRIRGFVRVGARRWDVALAGDVTLMLPETDPVAGLEAALALQKRKRVFDRDVVALDMRLPERPTLRLTERGVAALAEKDAAREAARKAARRERGA